MRAQGVEKVPIMGIFITKWREHRPSFWTLTILYLLLGFSYLAFFAAWSWAFYPAFLMTLTLGGFFLAGHISDRVDGSKWPFYVTLERYSIYALCTTGMVVLVAFKWLL